MLTMLLLVLTMFSGAEAHSVRGPERLHVVFMIGEDEYHTWETLPDFAKKELDPNKYYVTIINGDTNDKNSFPGLVNALQTADLLVVSTRRRTPPADQLNAVRAYLAAGKPLIGIRTACHAFALRPNDPPASPGHATWQEFDPEVLGGHYTNHHPAEPKTVIVAAPGAAKQPILKDVAVNLLVGNGSLYKVSPLVNGTTPLLIGSIPDQPSEPIAWTHEYGPKRARVFYTSLGHPDDFQNPEFRRLLVNAVGWAIAK